MTELEADCLKTDRAPWPRRRHKAELAGGGSDAMQVKGKKLGHGVSMKSLKGAHFEVDFQGNSNESKSCRMTTEKVYSSEIQDDPRYGS